MDFNKTSLEFDNYFDKQLKEITKATGIQFHKMYANIVPMLSGQFQTESFKTFNNKNLTEEQKKTKMGEEYTKVLRYFSKNLMEQMLYTNGDVSPNYIYMEEEGSYLNSNKHS